MKVVKRKRRRKRKKKARMMIRLGPRKSRRPTSKQGWNHTVKKWGGIWIYLAWTTFLRYVSYTKSPLWVLGVEANSPKSLVKLIRMKWASVSVVAILRWSSQNTEIKHRWAWCVPGWVSYWARITNCYPFRYDFCKLFTCCAQFGKRKVCYHFSPVASFYFPFPIGMSVCSFFLFCSDFFL
jgi:hypothetical protein